MAFQGVLQGLQFLFAFNNSESDSFPCWTERTSITRGASNTELFGDEELCKVAKPLIDFTAYISIKSWAEASKGGHRFLPKSVSFQPPRIILHNGPVQLFGDGFFSHDPLIVQPAVSPATPCTAPKRSISPMYIQRSVKNFSSLACLEYGPKGRPWGSDPISPFATGLDLSILLSLPA